MVSLCNSKLFFFPRMRCLLKYKPQYKRLLTADIPHYIYVIVLLEIWPNNTNDNYNDYNKSNSRNKNYASKKIIIAVIIVYSVSGQRAY